MPRSHTPHLAVSQVLLYRPSCSFVLGDLSLRAKSLSYGCTWELAGCQLLYRNRRWWCFVQFLQVQHATCTSSNSACELPDNTTIEIQYEGNGVLASLAFSAVVLRTSSTHLSVATPVQSSVPQLNAPRWSLPCSNQATGNYFRDYCWDTRRVKVVSQ